MKLIYVLSTLFALGVTPAFADPVQEPQHLRKCELVKTADGREMCAYELDDWVHALRVDALVTHQQVMMGKMEERIEILEEQKIDFQKQIQALTDNQGLLIKQNDKLTQDLIDLDKKYQEERVKPSWGSPLAWTTAAVSAAVLAGFVIHESLD